MWPAAAEGQYHYGSQTCNELERAISRRNAYCNLGNYYNSTKCKYRDGTTMESSFLIVCRACTGRALGAEHPGYSNVRCETAPRVGQAPTPPLPPAPPAPSPDSGRTGYVQVVPGPMPAAADCNSLRKFVNSGNPYCTLVNLYDAYYCKTADGKDNLLAGFIARCPSCLGKEARHNSARRCDAPPPRAQLGERQPSSIIFDGTIVSVRNAVSEMVGHFTADTIMRDYYALLKNPVKPMGAISATFETRGAASPMNSIGNEADGTRSYGVWQINSSRRMEEFLGMIARHELPGAGVSAANQDRIYAILMSGQASRKAAARNASAKPSHFASQWQSISAIPALADDFKEIQREFVKKTHHDLCLGRLKAKYPGVALLDHPVLQENIWSTSIQFGPGNDSAGCVKIVSRGIEDVRAAGRGSSIHDAVRKVTDRKIQERAERDRYNKEGAIGLWILNNI